MAETPIHNQDPHQAFRASIAEHHRSLEELARGSGVLVAIAGVKVARDQHLAVQLAERFGVDTLPPVAELSPDQIFATILEKPKSGEPLSPRWELVKALNAAVGEEVEKRADEVVAAAVTVSMRRSGETEDYRAIVPQAAIFGAEGGANKTSVVRRGVAEAGMRAALGPNLAGQTLYQLGSGRVVPLKRPDGSDNPEHKIISGLAGDYLQLRDDGSFEEFDANVATARADGYVITGDTEPDQPEIARVVTLAHTGSERPGLVAVKTTGVGLPGGFDAIRAIKAAQGETLEGRQLVVASNGQYRPKSRLQAVRWAQQHGIDMIPAVALGDEPGDIWNFKGEQMATPPRPPAAYVNELALYGAQSGAFLAA